MRSHFAGKTVTGHLLAKRADGVTSESELHGGYPADHLAAGCDGARDIAIALLVIWIIGTGMGLPLSTLALVLGVFSLAWMIWKAARNGLAGWGKLEKLHRVIDQERWEIEHNRAQEREEVEALYRLKGFEGQLLEEVVDVLVADNDRLLRVMVEEELGLRLLSHEHPLKQAVGTAIGVLIAAGLSGFGLALMPSIGLPIGAGIALVWATYLSASRSGNRILPALIWTLAIAGLSAATAYFVLELIR